MGFWLVFCFFNILYFYTDWASQLPFFTSKHLLISFSAHVHFVCYAIQLHLIRLQERSYFLMWRYFISVASCHGIFKSSKKPFGFPIRSRRATAR